MSKEENKAVEVIGKLTYGEKQQKIEIDNLGQQIRDLMAEHKARKTMFWTGLELRLKEYGPIQINPETDEISKMDDECDGCEAIGQLIKGLFGSEEE